MKKWYIVFETFVLCKQGTVEPSPFDSKEDCQRHIDNHCDPREFPEVEFVESDDPDAVMEYARNK